MLKASRAQSVVQVASKALKAVCAQRVQVALRAQWQWGLNGLEGCKGHWRHCGLKKFKGHYCVLHIGYYARYMGHLKPTIWTHFKPHQIASNHDAVPYGTLKALRAQWVLMALKAQSVVQGALKALKSQCHQCPWAPGDHWTLNAHWNLYASMPLEPIEPSMPSVTAMCQCPLNPLSINTFSAFWNFGIHWALNARWSLQCPLNPLSPLNSQRLLFPLNSQYFNTSWAPWSHWAFNAPYAPWTPSPLSLEPSMPLDPLSPLKLQCPLNPCSPLNLQCPQCPLNLQCPQCSLSPLRHPTFMASKTLLTFVIHICMYV